MSKPSGELAEHVAHRLSVWEECAARRQAEAAAKSEPIQVTLPDGTVKDAESWVTTPLDIAKSISGGLARATMVALVDGEYWDAMRPLERSCGLELCSFATAAGKHAFWHSSAHILGHAIEQQFKAFLTIGPPLEDGGFYYDAELPDERKVTPEDYERLNKFAKALTKGKHPFVRLELEKEEAKEMFKFNKYKLEIIEDKVPDGERCTAYRCGPLIDLCKGPHVPNTGLIKAMAVLKHSACYWKANAERESLQRVYGISFPKAKELKEHLKLLEEQAKRDHRRLGVEQKLFFFHDQSPGSAFFLPHGTRIYNTLIKFIRSEYRKRGFTEVVTPNMYNVDLWKTSGHYKHYAENMFRFDVEKQEFALKPMNCPGHCLMFKHETRSHRDLPLRLADFGVLHRNELSGALSGLTRVRRFQQDDAHIFCRVDQIEDEMDACLDFLQFVYGCFGMSFELTLSTRPDKYLGELSDWEEAEASLQRCLDRFCESRGEKWELNPGDGAFYGPKIDILVTDALKRKHQCATIQLDFQLPQRFKLHYKDAEGSESRPVMIHRAILGSVERMIAVLIEHTGGKWPLWLSPRQAIVIPIYPDLIDAATKVRDMFHDAGFYCDVDDSKRKFKKSVREAQLAQYNYIFVVGRQEAEAEQLSVNIRLRNNDVIGVKTVEETIALMNEQIANFE